MYAMFAPHLNWFNQILSILIMFEFHKIYGNEKMTLKDENRNI